MTGQDSTGQIFLRDDHGSRSSIEVVFLFFSSCKHKSSRISPSLISHGSVTNEEILNPPSGLTRCRHPNASRRGHQVFLSRSLCIYKTAPRSRRWLRLFHSSAGGWSTHDVRGADGEDIRHCHTVWGRPSWAGTVHVRAFKMGRLHVSPWAGYVGCFEH